MRTIHDKMSHLLLRRRPWFIAIFQACLEMCIRDSIITVNYKGGDATERFLKSASELEGWDESRLIVVENGSNDGSADKLRPLVGEFANVELLESEGNRGYFGAAHWALEHYLARAQKPEWVIICNNDVVCLLYTSRCV